MATRQIFQAVQYTWPLLLLIVANGLIIVHTPASLRYIAVLVLLLFLPGWVWLRAFFRQPINLAERLTLAIGLSLALTIFGVMFTVYLPGSLTTSQLLITSNVISVAGLMAIGWQQRSRLCPSAPRPLYASAQRYVLLILVLLLLLTAALRLPRLGYAEFHEDEAETLMLGTRLLQGEDYALFLHRKGPAQMLVPVAFWLLTGRISESWARFPFALSSLLSVATLFFLGRRWFNWPAGLIAGLLWAINGYAIGFGRMVQYQALIFFLGPLALYCLYLAWKYDRPRWQILGAILLAACLLAHFDALLLLPAAAYLGWLAVRRRSPSRVQAEKQQGSGEKEYSPRLRSRLMAAAMALILFLALLASFYVPYLLDPEFNHTATYLSESRIKPGLLYNNLHRLQRLDKDYSSRFYLPILVLGIIGFIFWQSASFSRANSARSGFRNPLRATLARLSAPKKWPWLIFGPGLLLASTWWFPNLWQVGSLSLAILPWLLLGLICFWLFPTPEVRAAWLMFGAAFIGYVFLVEDPRTHLYIMYPGAVLLAGAGWVALVGWVDGWLGSWLGEAKSRARLRPFRFLNLLVLLLLVIIIAFLGAIIIYDALIFLPTESALTQLRRGWDGSIWETIYDDLPKTRSYFGYPKREGWKAIGALRAQDKFPGDFRSINEDFIVPIWYNYGQARSCYNTPAHFFVRSPENEVSLTDSLTGYAEVGRVVREGEARLRIFSTGARPEVPPPTYSLEAFVDAFDQLATPRQFTRQAEPSQFAGTQFGPAIQFTGYDLATNRVAPGDTLHLNLYWLALKNPGPRNYRAFVHLTDGTTLWSQQDDEPACRLPTAIWRAGQRSMGQFRLPINPATPPGRYPLIIGLYQAETLERLPIVAGPGQIGDDFLWLGDIEVVASD